VIWDLADIADDKQSDWLRNRKNSQLDIFNYQSYHCWQWSSSAFIRYDCDFDNDSDDDNATFAV